MRPLGRIYSAAPPAFDLRRNPRYPIRHLGKILTEPNASPQYCLVEEASDSGVRIRATSDFESPSVFILRFAEQEATYKVIANTHKSAHQSARRYTGAASWRLNCLHRRGYRDAGGVQSAHFSRELDRFVIEALRAVKRQGGEQAFDRTARDLVISVCAILAYERGTEVTLGLFDLIERVLAEGQ